VSSVYILDIDDFRPLAQVAARNPDVTVLRRGPYFELRAEVAYDIDRNATGCRNAVWYSSVAALDGARISMWDKTTLRVEPTVGGPQ
jgi:hypothetical protein